MKSLWDWDKEQMNPLKMKFTSAPEVERLVEQLNEKISFLRDTYKVSVSIEIYSERAIPVVDEHVTILAKKNGTLFRPREEIPVAKALVHQIFLDFQEKLEEYQKKQNRKITFRHKLLPSGAQGVEIVHNREKPSRSPRSARGNSEPAEEV